MAIAKTVFLRHVSSISGIVRKELLGEKVLYNGILVAVTLLFLALLASQLSFSNPERIVMTLGLGVVRVGLVGTGLLLAASVIPREYARRTALIILSRPVSGYEFAIGIYAGIASVIALNWIILSGFYVGALLLMGGGLSGMLIVALLACLIESLVVVAIGLLFSVYSTPAVSVSVTLGIFVVGSSYSELRFLAARAEGFSSVFFDFISFFIPNLERFQLTSNLVHLIPLTGTYSLGVIAYAAVWIAIMLTGTGALVSWKKT